MTKLTKKERKVAAAAAAKRAKKGSKILIDLEFNGLPRYNFLPEITQIKMRNLNNGKEICRNFKTKNEGAPLHEFYEEFETEEGETFFSFEEFVACCESIGVDPMNQNNQWFGFSIETDTRLLKKYLSIDERESHNGFPTFSKIFGGRYHDISWELRFHKKWEKIIALGGSSLEFCYYMVTKEKKEKDHSGLRELEIIHRLYKAAYKGKRSKHLHLYPFGDDAGYPLEKYVCDNRRRADGYRYNNNNPLSNALDYYIQKKEEEDWDY